MQNEREQTTHPANPLALQLSQQPLPTRINVVAAKALLGVKAHVRDVTEAGRFSNHALVDSALLLFGRARLLRRRGGGGTARLCGVLVSERDLLEQLSGFRLGGEGEANHAFLLRRIASAQARGGAGERVEKRTSLGKV
jgi:hypothetical protein